jgi:hypothetical protein
MGSPPPTGSKKVVLKFRSVNSIVRAAAKTGREKANKKEVIRTDQTNKGTLDQDIPLTFILKIVTIKLIAPKIEEIPATCNLRIPKSTAGPS